MKVAVTGGYGFLGWHLACRALGTRGWEVLRLGRSDFVDPDGLAAQLAEVDTVIHIAGVNRAETEEAVEHGNVEVAEALTTALGNRAVHLVYANSIQADRDNAYGRGKRKAGEILARLPGTFANVYLPNLFGEHGRPGYNSFVATFAHEVAAGRMPNVNDSQVPLLHAQDAAEVLLSAAEQPTDQDLRPAGQPRGVVEVLELLQGFHDIYAERGEIPDVSDPFHRDLFNTYRACRFPDGYPIHPQLHADNRGVLAETGRAHGGTSQSFVSSTYPGQRRGDHWHLHKIERFCVVRGSAEIALRRLFDDEVVRFQLTGDRPGFVDMPTMWVHNITNTGDTDLITVFWADQLLDPENPDQYPMQVEAQ